MCTMATSVTETDCGTTTTQSWEPYLSGSTDAVRKDHLPGNLSLEGLNITL